jgi:hypothetical protein
MYSLLQNTYMNRLGVNYSTFTMNSIQLDERHCNARVRKHSNLLTYLLFRTV